MSKFCNESTGVVVSVADSKDGRFTDGWVSAKTEPKRVPGRPKKRESASK